MLLLLYYFYARLTVPRRHRCGVVVAEVEPTPGPERSVRIRAVALLPSKTFVTLSLNGCGDSPDSPQITPRDSAGNTSPTRTARGCSVPLAV